MPNEILNIQHTITQLQNVEKVQAVGQQREQYQEKQEAVHLQAKRDLEQTVVQISEEAEKVFLQEEGENDKEKRGNGEREKRGENEEMPHDANVHRENLPLPTGNGGGGMGSIFITWG